MKAARLIVEFIDKADGPNLGAQPRFFVDLAGQIVRQRTVGLGAAAGGTPQSRTMVCPRIHEKQPAVVHNKPADGDADRAAARQHVRAPFPGRRPVGKRLLAGSGPLPCRATAPWTA